MHPSAFEFVSRFATRNAISVIEIGSRDINGSVRAHFPNAKWTGLDLYAGPAVDWVGDAIHYDAPELVDVVICCEVFEHTANWKPLLERAYRWLKPGGRIIVTCAGIGRAEHSAIDGGHVLHAGEWYQNISAWRLRDAMFDSEFVDVSTIDNAVACDTYGTAIRRA